ncbi:MAG: hypothetical protein IT165_11675 [Bryobacterales bacterium]|nr:hypothetical protein [Bryobacterales bacterium]
MKAHILGLSLFAACLLAHPAPAAGAQAPSPVAQSANTYSGTLVDSNCNPSTQRAACEVSASTSSFALLANGKVYAFDNAGNVAAQKELKSSGKTGTVSVTVTGKMSGAMIQVDNIKIH